MAKSKAIAITVFPYYLNNKVWALKLMSICLSNTGVFVWHTKKTLCVNGNPEKLQSMGIEYGLDKNIPYILSLAQGDIVVERDQYLLEKHYSSKLSELIT